jgi:F0F1-type ATP synthase membrane subunit b/b'
MPEETNSHISKYLEAIDRADDELASLRGSYMAECKGPRETIREIKGEAREAGVNMRAFNVLLTGHRSERKQAKRVTALEQEDFDALELLREQLGPFADTPLGEAALAEAGDRRRRGREDGLDELKA